VSTDSRLMRVQAACTTAYNGEKYDAAYYSYHFEGSSTGSDTVYGRWRNIEQAGFSEATYYLYHRSLQSVGRCLRCQLLSKLVVLLSQSKVVLIPLY